jgi:glycosyltransferase involved in cell wall biosynthesis
VAKAPSDDRPLVLLLGAPLPPPYGGIARYMQLALPELARRGFRLRVLRPFHVIKPAPVEDLPEDADFKTAEMEYPGALPVLAWMLRHPRVTLTLLRWFGTALLRSPRFAAGQVAASASWVRSAERLLDGEQPAIVHSYDLPWLHGSAAVLVARRRGGRSMITIFGDVLPHRDELRQFDPVSRPFAAGTRVVLESADVVASMTKHCCALVRHAGFPPEKVELVRIIGHMDSFRPDVDGSAIRARHTDGDGPLVLYVGQIRPRKGPQVLVEALPAIRDRHRRARVVFVGPDHDYVAELRAQASSLGVEDSVDFAGEVADRELPKYYAAADVFVFPTVTGIECLGLTFVQAMFAGNPVIASEIAGAPEVIRDRLDGFLVEPGNGRLLAERVSEVLDLPLTERAELGARARSRVAGLFDERAVLDDLFGAYDRLR